MCDFFCNLNEVEDERDELEKKVNILISQKKILKDDQKRIKLKRADIADYPSEEIIAKLYEKNLIPLIVE